jgi:hypothetical protein
MKWLPIVHWLPFNQPNIQLLTKPGRTVNESGKKKEVTRTISAELLTEQSGNLNDPLARIRMIILHHFLF